MNEQVCRNRTVSALVAFLCVFTLTGVLCADDRVPAILEKSGFAGGVVAHVHGADASLLRAVEQRRPNLLGHLLVAQ